MEYDREQNDKYGRILAWVWINCESTPRFKNPFYMHLSKNKSKESLFNNPKGCQKGKLVNEELITNKQAVFVKYKNKGKLKYEDRLRGLFE